MVVAGPKNLQKPALEHASEMVPGGGDHLRSMLKGPFLIVFGDSQAVLGCPRILVASSNCGGTQKPPEISPWACFGDGPRGGDHLRSMLKGLFLMVFGDSQAVLGSPRILVASSSCGGSRTQKPPEISA